MRFIVRCLIHEKKFCLFWQKRSHSIKTQIFKAECYSNTCRYYLIRVPPKIALPQLQEIRYVQVGDIIRCEADNTYTHFFLDSGEQLLISKHLKEYADMLQPHGFIRSQQSHLVNPAYVKSWLKEDGGTLLLTTGDKVPVSKPNRERVKNLLNK